MRCEVCGSELYDWECDDACWYCEQDLKEPEPDHLN